MNQIINRSKKMKNKKGFTLVELIVVIVIIGILAAIIIPRLSGFSDNAKAKADLATARTLATAASAVYSSSPGAMDYDAESDYTSPASISAYLPDSFDAKSQVTGKVFETTVTANGNVTVTDGDTTLVK